MYECILINPRPFFLAGADRLPPDHYAGLLSIASLLSARGHPARVLDAAAVDDPLAALRKHLDDSRGKLVIVGLSVMTAQLRHAIELSKFLRARCPGIPILWGGVHATLFAEQICRSGLADFVCMGEGEYTLLELISVLKADGDASSVSGLCLLKDGAVAFTGPRAPHSLDDLPYFDYDLTDYPQSLERPIDTGEGEPRIGRYGVVVTGVGCPYQCTFCINSNKKLYLGKYRAKSVGRILDEIAFLIDKHGIEYFEFVDDSFFVDKDHVRGFIRELRSRGMAFKWAACIRADDVGPRYVDSEMLKELESSGCYRLYLGAESGSQRILDRLKKGIRLADVLRTAEMLSRVSIGITYFFMLGFPGEEKEDVLATLDLMLDIEKIKPGAFRNVVQLFRPYPGSELYEECVRDYGYVSPRTTEEWEDALDLLTRAENLEKRTWIQDKRFIRKAMLYADIANMHFPEAGSGPLERAVFSLMKKIAAFRIRRRFWGLPLDMRLLHYYMVLRGMAGAAIRRPR